MGWPVGELTVREFKQRLDAGERWLVLDVRQPPERAHCSIALPANAVDLHVPMTELFTSIEEVRKSAGDLPIMVYCREGIRSWNAAMNLSKQGVTGLWSLTGGIDAWAAEIDPSLPRY